MASKIAMRVIKGGFIPASKYAEDELRSRKFSVGDVVIVTVNKPRNPQFYRLAHAMGKMLAENLDAFTGKDWHDVLKTVQLQGGIYCEDSIVEIGAGTKVKVSKPQSLSFESMDETDFSDFYQQVCRYVAATYWPELTPEKIEEMAWVMSDE